MRKRVLAYGSALIFCYLCVLDMAATRGEEIFRWVDEKGNISYSNIAPPAVNVAYTKKVIANKMPSDTPAANESEMTTCHVSDDRQVPADALDKRICSRRKSIHRLEGLIKQSPNNQALRQNLIRQKIYLLEALRILETK